ncbi:hypothetical protein LguiA_008426 [Lonicera macranthoides]
MRLQQPLMPSSYNDFTSWKKPILHSEYGIYMIHLFHIIKNEKHLLMTKKISDLYESFINVMYLSLFPPRYI